MSFLTPAPNSLITDSATTSYAGYLEAIDGMAVEDESSASPREGIFRDTASSHRAHPAVHTVLRESRRLTLHGDDAVERVRKRLPDGLFAAAGDSQSVNNPVIEEGGRVKRYGVQKIKNSRIENGTGIPQEAKFFASDDVLTMLTGGTASRHDRDPVQDIIIPIGGHMTGQTYEDTLAATVSILPNMVEILQEILVQYPELEVAAKAADTMLESQSFKESSPEQQRVILETWLTAQVNIYGPELLLIPLLTINETSPEKMVDAFLTGMANEIVRSETISPPGDSDDEGNG